jgi:hypothetical protein
MKRAKTRHGELALIKGLVKWRGGMKRGEGVGCEMEINV